MAHALPCSQLNTRRGTAQHTRAAASAGFSSVRTGYLETRPGDDAHVPLDSSWSRRGIRHYTSEESILRWVCCKTITDELLKKR